MCYVRMRETHTRLNTLHALVTLRDPVRILTRFLPPKAAGQTPLHIAAEEGDEATVKYFYSVHANPNITDKFGEFLVRSYNEILFL